jgi:hypothetical protein
MGPADPRPDDPVQIVLDEDVKEPQWSRPRISRFSAGLTGRAGQPGRVHHAAMEPAEDRLDASSPMISVHWPPGRNGAGRGLAG